MRVNYWLKNLVLVPAVSLAVLPVFAQQQQQQGSAQQQTSDPVADAARKAREQKKSAAKPKKVYTEDDIAPRTPAPSGAAAAANTEAGNEATKDTTQDGKAATADAAGSTAPADKNDEETWRRKFREQRDKIAQAETELNILQREEEKAQVQYYPDPQKAMQEQNNRKEFKDKRGKIDAKKQEIAGLKQQLDDMESALRKAGGDPGWAR